MKRKRSLQSKLIRLLMMLGMLPLIVFIAFSYSGIKKIIIEKTGVNLQKAAREKALRIDLVIKEKIDLVKEIAEEEDFRQGCAHLLEGESGEKLLEYSEQVSHVLQRNKELQDIAVVNSYGKVLFAAKKSGGIVDNLSNWWMDVLKKEEQGNVFLANLQFLFKKFKLTIDIVVPISEKNEGVHHYLVFRVNLKEVILLTWMVQQDEPRVTIFRDDGLVLLDTSEFFYPIIIPRQILVEAYLGKNGWRKGLGNRKGQGLILGYACLDGLNDFKKDKGNYYLMASIDEKMVLMPLLRSYFHSFLVIFIIIFLILIAALLDLNKITRPLFLLKKGVEMTGKGNLDFRLDVKTGDEIEELAETFNQMSSNLKASKIKLEEQNEELVRLNEIKSNFLSLVSHELRTPLMIIQESVSQILDGLKGPITEDQKEFLGMTKRNVLRLNKIIADLLNISKIESGKMMLRRKKSDIVKAINEEMEIYRFRAKEKGIRFLMDIPRESVTLYCDEDKLKMIIANLVGNALKFTPSGGYVKLNILDRLNELEIIVSDNGQGIDLRNHSKIFDKFERLDNIPLTGKPSTGLGLAIVKELVHLHRGKIWVESEKGEGSQFHVVFHKYTENRYFKEFFKEKIKQAEENQMELSVLVLRLTECEKIYVDPMKKRKLFSQLVNISFNFIFDYEEIIPLKNVDEIYAFLFADDKSAELIKGRLNRIIADYLEQKRLKDVFLVNTLSVTFPNDGVDLKSLLRTAGKLFHYLEPLRKKTKKIGELLLESGILSDEELGKALNQQRRTGGLLGKILIEKGAVNMADMSGILSQQLGLQVFDKEKYDTAQKKPFQILPKEFIIKYKLIPVDMREKILTVAMVNPFDIQTIKQVYRLTYSQTVVIQLIMEQEFDSLISDLLSKEGNEQ